MFTTSEHCRGFGEGFVEIDIKTRLFLLNSFSLFNWNGIGLAVESNATCLL